VFAPSRHIQSSPSNYYYYRSDKLEAEVVGVDESGTGNKKGRRDELWSRENGVAKGQFIIISLLLLLRLVKKAIERKREGFVKSCIDSHLFGALHHRLTINSQVIKLSLVNKFMGSWRKVFESQPSMACSVTRKTKGRQSRGREKL
jgi:hypothetical protein